MTSPNARLNSTATTNQQLRTFCMQQALVNRRPDETMEQTVEHAKAMYAFVKEPESTLVKAQVVS